MLLASTRYYSPIYPASVDAIVDADGRIVLDQTRAGRAATLIVNVDAIPIASLHGFLERPGILRRTVEVQDSVAFVKCSL